MDARAVGQRIKAAREKKNMTQEDLAACIDISPTHVSVIERGTKIPRMCLAYLRMTFWWMWWIERLPELLRSFLPPSRRSLTKKGCGS